MMGDERRGILFSQFIKRQFPRAKTILDVAGGKGNVARKLANKGFHVTVIDMKPRFEGNSHKHIVYKKGRFNEEYGRLNADLVIGMHPDEATCEIVRYSVRHRLPFAVVPCCILGRDSSGIHSFEGWVNKLKSIAAKTHNVREYTLRMNGKNLVIYGRLKS